MIYKPHESGGPGPRWTAAPQEKNIIILYKNNNAIIIIIIIIYGRRKDKIRNNIIKQKMNVTRSLLEDINPLAPELFF